MPTVGSSTHKSSTLNGKSNIMNQSFQTEQTSQKITADFANFDQASFGDRNGKYPSSKYLKLQVSYYSQYGSTRKYYNANIGDNFRCR